MQRDPNTVLGVQISTGGKGLPESSNAKLNLE